MALPNEMIEAIAQCLGTGFFHKYKMEAFLSMVGVDKLLIDRYRSEKKSLGARCIVLELNQSESGQMIQKRLVAELCRLTSAPDDNANVDNDAAIAALGHLKNLAMRYRESLACSTFATSDPILDGLLETARKKFLDPDVHDRREALEKLWDAWERLKTLEAEDKKRSVGLLLDKASRDSRFREVLEVEAKTLTEIGNSFMIRHTEVGKAPIRQDEHVDYLFHRMFDLIRLLLRTTGRGG